MDEDQKELLEIYQCQQKLRIKSCSECSFDDCKIIQSRDKMPKCIKTGNEILSDFPTFPDYHILTKEETKKYDKKANEQWVSVNWLKEQIKAERKKHEGCTPEDCGACFILDWLNHKLEG